jgi:hypothetical protein
MKSVNKVILIGNLGCGAEKDMKVGFNPTRSWGRTFWITH